MLIALLSLTSTALAAPPTPLARDWDAIMASGSSAQECSTTWSDLIFDSRNKAGVAGSDDDLSEYAIGWSEYLAPADEHVVVTLFDGTDTAVGGAEAWSNGTLTVSGEVQHMEPVVYRASCSTPDIRQRYFVRIWTDEHPTDGILAIVW